jgi:hypothetical protein
MKGRDKFLGMILCLLVAVPATFGSAAFGATLNVRLPDTAGPGDYTTIQDAIDDAAIGDEVLVADGTYMGNRNVKLFVDRKVTIRSQNGPNYSTIDCEGNGRAITFSGAATEGAVLRGFTIKGGNLVDRGGGILCQSGAKPTIDNCIITGNTAIVKVVNPVTGTVTEMGFGGGIACVLNSSPVITNCHIEGNSAGSGGGGLSCTNSSSPMITSCTITKNNGGNFGGGVYMASQSSPSISSSMVTGNSAARYGAGFYCSGTSLPSITNCTLAENSTSDAAAEGGGLYLYSGSQATITNSILWDNSASLGPEIRVKNQGSYPCILKVRHSNVKGGKDTVVVDTQLAATGSASTTSTSTLEWDDSNIDIDPKFVDEAAEDYHLAPNSPCVNAATQKDVTLSESDFEGDARVLNSTPDMGADESQPVITEYEVQMSVMPGSRNKKINLGAWGFLPVAVFSTPDFDATSIDPGTVEFAGAEPLHWVRTRVNRDRKADMLFFFWIGHLQFGLDENSTERIATSEVTLTGESSDKGPIIGADTVTIVKPKHKWHWWSKFEQTSHKKGRCNSK